MDSTMLVSHLEHTFTNLQYFAHSLACEALHESFKVTAPMLMERILTALHTNGCLLKTVKNIFTIR